MKTITMPLLLIAALTCTPALAVPMLSADGGTLSGVDVNGTLYDVMFADGIVGAVFPAPIVDAPGWQQLADDVSTAVVAALNSIATLAPTDLMGCEDPNGCILFLPDTRPGADYSDNDTATLFVSFAVNTGTHTLPASFDSGGIQANYTLMTFAPQGVPVPATFALFSLGLASLGMGYRKRPQRS